MVATSSPSRRNEAEMTMRMRWNKSWALLVSLFWLGGCTIHTGSHAEYPESDDGQSAAVAKHKKKKKKKKADDDAAHATSGGEHAADKPKDEAPAPAAGGDQNANAGSTPAAEP